MVKQQVHPSPLETLHKAHNTPRNPAHSPLPTCTKPTAPPQTLQPTVHQKATTRGHLASPCKPDRVGFSTTSQCPPKTLPARNNPKTSPMLPA
mgnify:CR=1 FL=1